MSQLLIKLQFTNPKNLYILFTIAAFYSCGAPKNYTYYYSGENSDLNKLININGYYVSQHGCDSTFFSIYMFYPDGLFTIATTANVSPELVDCFTSGGSSNTCKYPSWGTYRIEGGLIKTQTIRTEGNGCVIFRDYKILDNGSILNISDYVQPEYSNLGYMKNYPSFKTNECKVAAKFYPTESKRKTDECPLLKKKWFMKKQK